MIQQYTYRQMKQKKENRIFPGIISVLHLPADRPPRSLVSPHRAVLTMDLLGTVRGHVVAGTEERLTDAIMICTDPAHLGDPQFVALMNVASCKLASLASSPGASAAPTSPPAREPATPPTRQAAGSAPPQFMDLTEDAAAEPAAPPPPKVGLSQAQQLDRALDGSALDGAGVDRGQWMYLHKVKLDDATLRRLNNGQPISAEGLLGKHSSGPCAVKATGAALGVDPQKRTALCSNIITEWAKAGLNWRGPLLLLSASVATLTSSIHRTGTSSSASRGPTRSCPHGSTTRASPRTSSRCCGLHG